MTTIRAHLLGFQRTWIVFLFLFPVSRSFQMLNNKSVVDSPRILNSRHRLAAMEDNGSNIGHEERSVNMERAWRSVRKPLLSIGAQGAKLSHGNSLRQLLDAHTVVKVKVNTQTTTDLETAFNILRDLAVQSGASPDMECLQCRKSDRILLVGLPGTRERIERGEFPPSS